LWGGSIVALLAALLLTIFVNEHPAVDAANPYKVNYTVTDKWNNGYSVAVTITNTGSTSINGWTISWALNQGEQRIDAPWGAGCKLSGNQVSCSNLTNNARIAAGKSVDFGLDFYGNGQITTPATFIVNGVNVSNSVTATPTVATATPTKTPVAPTATKTPLTSTPTATAQPSATATKVPTSPTAAPPTTTAQPGATPTQSPITTPQPTTGWWKPTPDQPIHWHWQLTGTFVFPTDVVPGATVYDIDGELNTADTVAKLHSLGPNVKVICYFDAGVYENYRSDANRFPTSVIGNADTGWDGSYWLDIRQTNVLLPIMQDRMQNWCKNKGFDAIEPDETEVWSNNPGFPITKVQNNYYNQQIAAMAHSLGLSVGLKGNTSEAPDLWNYFDWTLNEQCWQYQECDVLKSSFIDHGKAVLNIEYEVNPNCATANSWHMNSARRDLNLVAPTNAAYSYSPCIPNTQNNW
jgi:hypothetical protein